MRPDRITKLYDRLTNKERAALAFHYLADKNETELGRIVETVPRANYCGLDAEFRTWLNGFFHLATLWAVEHWQLQAQKLAALGGMFISHECGDREQADAMAAAYRLWEARLLALDRAIEAICGEHGFSVEAVRHLAKAEAFSPFGADVVPDDNYLNEVREGFASIVAMFERCRDV